MFLAIVCTSLITSIFILIFSRRLSNKGVALFSSISMVLVHILSVISLLEAGFNQSVVEIKGPVWFLDLFYLISWGFIFDNFNLFILTMISGVSFVIHFYSIEYMSSDPRQSRFMLYLTLFSFSMIILVSSDNLMQLFLGWEAIGIFSFLLINFWFTWVEANKSALKAVIINRVGDFFLSLSFFVLYYSVKSLSVYSILGIVIQFQDFIWPETCWFFLDLVALFCILGISAKSAQLPFHTWLVNAMSAPSPVSALIHAATLVTSGVFLVIRLSLLLEYSILLEWMSLLGATTALFSALIGLVQNDFKRIVAYSTASQLGYMVFTCGLSNYTASYFHLLNHGFFKALLFLGAGAVIRSLKNIQDIRYQGNLVSSLPLSYSYFLVGSFTLTGFPFLSGFYSKDIIIELAAVNHHWSGFYVYLISIITALLTAAYSTRLLFLIFLNSVALNKKTFESTQESGWAIGLALGVLSLFSIFNGYTFSDLFTGAGSDYFSNIIGQSINRFSLISIEFIHPIKKNIPFVFSMVSTILVLSVSYHSWQVPFGNFLKGLYQFLYHRAFIDYLQNALSGKFFIFSHVLTYKSLDHGLLETLGPAGLTYSYQKATPLLSQLNSGFLGLYLLTSLISIVSLLLAISLSINFEFVLVLFFLGLFF